MVSVVLEQEEYEKLIRVDERVRTLERLLNLKNGFLSEEEKNEILNIHVKKEILPDE